MFSYSGGSLTGCVTTALLGLCLVSVLALSVSVSYLCIVPVSLYDLGVISVRSLGLSTPGSFPILMQCFSVSSY